MDENTNLPQSENVTPGQAPESPETPSVSESPVIEGGSPSLESEVVEIPTEVAEPESVS